ncbi:NADH-dependent [FeFe] hydrogenase, group A6 [Acetobacterium woodii]|uniref:Iron hydrogenase HydA1 n=1 Tax=Acetobacterium woodii (strain ATCC 29683 / DSM 1030 / JCM 2381 / KCTC 1655 / WB1) TaxID=931626 RepID=H6LFG3_ACEWD|nr:NADH-dependent [FeFe] hydrogenase, group A6 [Acetobacterium woodii]7Q4V_A Chain A, Iron hydrogenase HydA1 [Acetobacterium woodii DSM 1030]7Q4V_E Chain E, Iron hydrogenase HydA1 [Acetobacterium woodii DSM 1030]7Q4W_A Chain A, Iron hydrogenase HydA1 [Acetobacterium woodii DSM 1030]7Q4W_E Chain E, Iron hydrogenase HydA1 [Acetobacterium woodii DSM 1030]8A5E_A Chain A, Iron hydrogenase HydA1 [Acetobacterium woodii DSM 1030]8A5E_D Chain D, Iron hydrogenase HydA1 [Acetobacterium woodii DSM 1030]
MKEITFKINGQEMIVPEGTTILEAARMNNIDIPTLCYLKDINEIGACRMCLVEIAGARALQAACVYPVANGIEVLTNSPKVREARRVNLELILSNHNRECTTCIRSENCELQTLATDLGVSDIPFEGEKSGKLIDDLSTSVVRDESKCILCKRCVSVCRDVQSVAVLGTVGRGFTSQVQPVFNKSLADVGCINCGQCIINCPVGALKEKSDIQRVWDAIADPSKTVIVQTAPAVRAALGEEFGYPMGTSVTGKMAAALRRLGFDKVFDTDFGADVCIMEEGTELIGRVTNGGVLPMITSCSPGWIKFIETYYPEAIPHLSSCKSPQNITGALLKNHYAQTNNIDPKDMVVVSIMPCTAKKYEVQREELCTDGNADVDISITTRELARMIKEARILFNKLPDEDFDDYYGESTGAAVIFGATGGVMEAAVRTVADVLNKKDIQEIDYQIVRGVDGIKKASVEVTPDLTVNLVVAHGGANIREVMEQLKAGELADTHFIELMACPGGCVNGGGQPIVSAKDKMDIDIRTERAKALYDEDANVLTYRKSHQNPSVIRLYEEYLEEPNSPKAHHILHTKYSAKPKLV